MVHGNTLGITLDVTHKPKMEGITIHGNAF